jgi:hypothetical protein
MRFWMTASISAYHGARAEKQGFTITLQRDFDAGAGAIESFPWEITRAFLNLISNGFYAATVRITENGGSNFEPVLCAATRNLGNSVEVRIRDNGIGIPAEVKGKSIQSFLHDQTRRRRHRAWPVHEPRHHREATRRNDRSRDGARAVHRIQDRIAPDEPKVVRSSGCARRWG